MTGRVASGRYIVHKAQYSRMSDSADAPNGDGELSERERIRERKLRELREQESGEDTDEEPGQATPNEPIEVDGPAALQRTIAEHDVVLVDCYADWCGPCQMMDPTIESLARESDAAVAKVDVDANPQIAQQVGARSIPTLLVFANGEVVERLVGAQDRASLESAIDAAA